MSTPTVQDQAQAVAAIEQLMQVLVKGLRAVQLYLPNNPVYQRAVENIRRGFEPVWEHTAELVLGVGETSFSWEGAEVLSQDSKGDSVAWVLFKDGVRSIAFQPGVEDDEMVRFLTVIHRARTLPADAADDLLTLLWEQDFQRIRYDFVELATEEVPRLERAEAEPPSPDDMRQEVQQEVAPEEERPAGLVSVEDFDSTLYFLDEKEIAYLQSEIEREYQQDLRGNVLAMLFDLLELQTYAAVRAELISILDNFIPYLLAVGDFRSVAFILREIQVVMQRAREVLPEHRQQLEEFPAKLAEPAALGQLLQSLDEALVHPTEEELGELFRELRPQALETIVAWLPKLTNERVRALLEAAARRLCQAYPDEVVKALGSGDPAVLLETIRLVSALKLPPIVPALGALLHTAAAEVKRAVVDALATMGTPGALKQLEAAIDDADRDVRIGAVRVLSAMGYRGAFPKVEAAVTGKSLRDGDLTEKTAFFEAYGLLAGPDGIVALEPMLESKGFMKKKVDPHTRACAAMALGKIGTPEAKAVLAAAAGDKDPLVRNAVSKALREIG